MAAWAGSTVRVVPDFESWATCSRATSFGNDRTLLGLTLRSVNREPSLPRGLLGGLVPNRPPGDTHGRAGGSELGPWPEPSC